MDVDVTQELTDLYTMYRAVLETLNERKFKQLRLLVNSMKSFIEIYDEEGEIAGKISDLHNKLPPSFLRGFRRDEGDDE